MDELMLAVWNGAVREAGEMARPISPEWLMARGFEKDNHPTGTVHYIILMPNLEEPGMGIEFGLIEVNAGEWSSHLRYLDTPRSAGIGGPKSQRTRGDVARLCRELGVPLKPTNH